MSGAFVTVLPGQFGFIRPDGGTGNILACAAAMAALPEPPCRGERVRFRVVMTPDGRRRAIDLVLIEKETTR
ncbi:hypothetical protein [Acidiphilium iwatense]|uniref:Uncharacterized protein n=1 Tax=Acidiphilium iwatense TaxID=768198 RepID=A0ABS9DYE1_9PROT|nr:hypothetical protein [Acidiphilium iwatense]MCF3947766.1 hypothetical protein [Acidiphilium iwatense]